ncbi:MAG: flagellar filament capping protein FliD [Leptonema sp. (in: bacteria)]
MPGPYVMPNASGMDTSSVIQKLIEVERIPLKRLEEDNKRNEIRIQAWEELRAKAKKLSDLSKDIYSFTGPFAQKKLYSSDEKSITGTVSPNVKEVNHKIQVLQLAKKHKIRSREIENNESIPPGKFSVIINDKEYSFDFKGGNIESLENLFKESSNKDFSVFLVNIGENKKILVFNSNIFGNRGRLGFKDQDKLLQFLEVIGQKGKIQEKKQGLEFNQSDFDNSELEIGTKKVIAKEKVNHFEYFFPLKDKVQSIEFELNYEKQENTEKKLEGKKKIYFGPEIKNKIENIEITAPNIEREKIFDSEDIIKDKQGIIDVEVSYNVLGTPKIKKFELEENKKKYQLDLKNFSEEEPITIHSLKFSKKFKGNLELKNLSVQYLEEENVIFEPLYVIEDAQNAKLLVNGIPIEKETNENISGIVTGVSLNLHSVTNGEVELKIEYDLQKILDKIREWVKSYNDLMGFIKENDKFDRTQDLQLLRSTNPNENIEDGLRKLEDSSGIFAGDPLVRRLVSILNYIIGNSYPTKINPSIRTLAQIGISTGKLGSSWEEIKKGLLIIDEEKLQESLRDDPDSVKELFSLDKNEDLIIDDGVAFRTNQELSDYVKISGGLISSRIDLLKEKIRDNKKIILNKELSLGRKEEMLRQKFGRMESTIQNSKSLNKFLQNKLGIKDE